MASPFQVGQPRRFGRSVTHALVSPPISASMSSSSFAEYCATSSRWAGSAARFVDSDGSVSRSYKTTSLSENRSSTFFGRFGSSGEKYRPKLRQKGALVYDENFHVPLVVTHPDVAGGDRSDALASGVDLAPTLLEMVGVEATAVATEFPALHGRNCSTY